ncbi:MAG: hypothetical protein AAF570_21405, partial [Bacteroidota bacterium]
NMTKNQSTNLEYIIAYLQHLSPEDLVDVDEFLNYLYKSANTKPKQLMCLILDKIGRKTTDEICDEVQRKFKPMVISNVTTRIINVLHDMLLLEGSLKQVARQSEQGHGTIMLRKRLLQVRVLAQRGRMEKVPVYLDIIERKARKGESFEELCEVLRLRQEMAFECGVGADFCAMEREIEALERVVRNLRRVRYACRAVPRSAPGTRELAGLGTLMSEVEADHKAMGHARLRFALMQLMTVLFQVDGNGKRAALQGREMMAFLKANAGLFSERCVGEAALLWAEAEMSAGEYKGAKTVLERYAMVLEGMKGEKARVYELHFLADLYRQKQAAARRSLEALEALHQQGETGPIESRLMSYRAGLLVQGQQLKEAHAFLSVHRPSRTEDPIWNFGTRVLGVMLAIETGATDTAEILHGRMLKFYYNQRLKSLLPGRWLTILKALKQLNKHGYNRRSAAPQLESILKLLSNSQAEMRWRPGGPELLPFHDWLQRICKVPRKAI